MPIGANGEFVSVDHVEEPSPDRKPAIVTTRPLRASSSDAPGLTPEEHRQRGEAADALWRELVRLAAGDG